MKGGKDVAAADVACRIGIPSPRRRKASEFPFSGDLRHADLNRFIRNRPE
jgi:hypothetical protein